MGHNHHFVFSHKATDKMVTLRRFNESHWVALDSIFIEDFRQCFQKWEQCWDYCIQSQVEYFEGD